MNWINVDSSSLRRFAYDKDTSLLTVQFTNGAIYMYQGVPPVVIADLVAASSKGQYFAAEIKNDYTYTKVSG